MQNEELRRAQGELEAVRARYFDLYDLAPIGYFTVSEAGMILEVNLTAANMLGVARGALVKQPLTRFILPEDRDIYYRRRKLLFETGAPQVCEMRMVKKDSAPFWAQMEARLAQNAEGAPVCRAVLSDITARNRVEAELQQVHDELEHRVTERTEALRQANEELRTDIINRKRAEEMLHRAEENFRRSLDDSPLGVRIVTIEGETIYANRAMLNFYGYDSIEELRTTPVKKRYTPESYAEFQIRRENRRKGEYDPFEYEVSIVRKNGEVRHLQVFRKEILWNGGRKFQTVCQDITERKQAEERIHASLREKEILLMEIHHRVKNNMQVICGLLDLQASSSKNSELIAMTHKSQSRIRSMALVHEKLYGSKDFARIDLAGYVRALSQDLFQAYKINPGEIALIVQTDGDVYVDINKAIPCGLILDELISNVLKYAFPGGGPGELRVIIHETKDTEIEIVVRDNGLGLPDDVDIHQPRSVGLHLVNGLVKNQLDGQIEVRRDNGTEFRIKFLL